MGKKSRAKKKAATGGGGNKSKRKSTKRDEVPFGVERATNESDNLPSIYQAYKDATLQFKAQLAGLVPTDIFASDLVHCFLDAADYVKDNGIAVTDVLLRNLRLAISVRKKYARRLMDGGDEGHAYFVVVLNYCHQVLKSCKEEGVEGKTTDGGEEAAEEDAFVNRFGALSPFEEESDSDDDASTDDDAPIARPEPPSEAYSLQDLVSFPDRAKCLFLFDSMAYHAHKVSLGMKNIKETLRMEARGEFSTERLVPELLAMGVLAKSSLLEVQAAERDLYLECPDLAESPYRILAVSFLSPMVNMLSQNVQTYSPLARTFNDTAAVGFVGDVIEGVFRGQMGDVKKVSETFSRRWKLPEHWRTKNLWLATKIVQMCLQNTQTQVEAKNGAWRRYFADEDEELMKTIPSFMEDDELWESNIGGERSILNTMRLLDLHGAYTAKEESDRDKHIFDDLMPVLLCCSGWNEDSNPAASIRGDMDSLLASLFLDIMHSKWRADSKAVPMERKMLPHIHLIREWTIGNMSAKPPFALTFALHLMLISVFELQGEGDVARLSSLAQRTFNKFLAQSEEHLLMMDVVPCQEGRENCLKHIVETTRSTFDPNETLAGIGNHEMLFWNPLSAGLALAYISFYVSLEGGFAAMSGPEATTVLHIYNALKCRGMVDEDLPVLSDIDQFLEKSLYVWNGWPNKPEMGKFTYRHSLCLGCPNEIALYKQALARYGHKGGKKPVKPNMTLSEIKRKRADSKRVAATIDSSEVSMTFKRHCLANFDLEEGMQDPSIPKHLQLDPSSPFPMSFQIHDAKLYLVYKAFTVEEDFLRYNMVAIGTIFNEFLCQFNRENHAGIARMEDLSEFPSDNPGDVRACLNVGIASDALMALDYDPDDEKYSYLAAAYEDFFGNLELERVCIY